MSWACGKKITYSTKGTPLDCQLKTIRGLPLGRDIAEGAKELYKEKIEKIQMLSDRIAKALAPAAFSLGPWVRKFRALSNPPG